MNKIIGICGLIGSGKGAISDILVNDYKFTKISFADSLKDAIAAIFSWPRNLLEGNTTESRIWREQVDTWWANRLGIENLTPRWVLQYWGTEVCRHGFHDDIWIASLEHKLNDIKNANIVIPDTRFINEINTIKHNNGQIWRVKRGVDPEWFTAYVSNGIEPLNIHSSDWHWARASIDIIIENTGTLANLAYIVGDNLK